MISIVGIMLGVLIGILSGIIIISLIEEIAKSSKNESSQMPVTKILIIPPLWFSTPWSTTLLKIVNLDDVLESYMLSLTVTFVLICLFPTIRFIIWAGNNMGKAGGNPNG